MRALLERFNVRVSAAYAVVATLWIVLTDSLTEMVSGGDSLVMTTISLIKGLGFVVVTTLALYAVLSAELRKRDRLERTLQDDIAGRRRVEEALRESEEKFRRLIESAPEAIILADKDGRILLTNAQVANVFGYSRDELVGQWVEKLIPERFQPAHTVHRGSFTAVAGAHRLREGRHLSALCKDGSEIPVEVGLSAIETADGTVVASFLSDISERERANEALRQSEERFSTVFRASPIGIAIIAVQGRRVIDANERFAEFTGYSREELLARDVVELGLWDRMENAAGLEHDLLEQGTLRNLEIHYSTKSGEPRDALVSLDLIELGSQPCVIVMMNDITERKRAEEALRESEERFTKIFRNSPIGISITSLARGQILDINDSYLDILGFRREEIVGHNPLDLNLWPDPGDRPADIQTFLSTVGIRGWEAQVRTKSGQIRDHLVSLEVINLGGEPCIVAMAQDITERKRAQQELINAELMRVELEKEKEYLTLKEQFVSIVSHEFRTPLSVIMSSGELVQRYHHRMSPERQAEHIQEIISQSSYMTGLLDDILTFNKARAGKMEFKPEPLDLKAFLRSALERIEFSDQGKHQYLFVTEGDLDRLMLDQKLLQHIVVNLLSNASKYSPEGSEVRLEVSRQGEEVVLRVSDQGIGIPPEAQGRLFEPFHRADNVGNISGTGLGLAIVKESVDLHRGAITCESELGKGTTFTVRLPAATGE